MHDFRYVGNKLCCEGVAVEALARRFGTPLYVYSQRTLTEHFQELDRALAGVEHLVCFSVKSNSNQSVLRVLARLGSGFDVVSGGELQRVRAAGGDPRRCAFAGVGKTEGEIEGRYRKIGEGLAQKGIPASHWVWSLALGRQHLWRFLGTEAFPEGAFEVFGQLELVQTLDQFFDRAVYHTIAGFETARAKP